MFVIFTTVKGISAIASIHPSWREAHDYLSDLVKIFEERKLIKEILDPGEETERVFIQTPRGVEMKLWIEELTQEQIDNFPKVPGADLYPSASPRERFVN